MCDQVGMCRNYVSFRPLSGSYISQWWYYIIIKGTEETVSVPYRGATFLNNEEIQLITNHEVSVPYRGATFLNDFLHNHIENHGHCFRPLSGSYISQLLVMFREDLRPVGFRPLSGSYISQYHPRNPMSCLGRIGGLRGKSNFIEIQLFWKVKSSHKSSI